MTTLMNSPDHFSVMKSGRSLDIKQQSSIFLYLEQVLTLTLLFWFCYPSPSYHHITAMLCTRYIDLMYMYGLVPRPPSTLQEERGVW